MPKLTKTVVDHAEVPAIGQAFVWCSEDRGFGVRINASGSRLKQSWHPKKARSERISNDKVGSVWRMLAKQALEGSEARGMRTAAAYVQFLILTGARSQEGARLTWDRLDLDGTVPSWHITAEQSKTGSVRTLPLSSQAVALLRDRPQTKANRYVFAGRGGKGHIGNPQGTWDAVSRVAGLHLSAHSMRRTFTNVCLKLGIEMWKVELLTSHVPTTTTLVHYTETGDLRETCAAEIQLVGDWIELQAIFAARETVASATN